MNRSYRTRFGPRKAVFHSPPSADECDTELRLEREAKRAGCILYNVVMPKINGVRKVHCFWAPMKYRVFGSDNAVSTNAMVGGCGMTERVSIIEHKPIPASVYETLNQRRDRLIALGFAVVEFEDSKVRRITGIRAFDFDLYRELAR